MRVMQSSYSLYCPSFDLIPSPSRVILPTNPNVKKGRRTPWYAPLKQRLLYLLINQWMGQITICAVGLVVILYAKKYYDKLLCRWNLKPRCSKL